MKLLRIGIDPCYKTNITDYALECSISNNGEPLTLIFPIEHVTPPPLQRRDVSFRRICMDGTVFALVGVSINSISNILTKKRDGMIIKRLKEVL